MTQPELDECRTLLQSKRAELIDGNPSRGSLAIKASDAEMDESRGVQGHELVVESQDGNAKMLRNVRSALVRIDEGTFGECLICHRYIPYELLSVTPWVSWCIVCRKAADARSSEPGARMEEVLATTGHSGVHRREDS